MAKKKESKQKKVPKPAASKKPSRPAPRAKSPKRELAAVSKEIRQVRQPIYNYNRKIKTAKSQYQVRKLKKERQAYIDFIEPMVSDLADQRAGLSQRTKKYQADKKERTSIKRKVSSLEKKIRDAVDNKDINKAEKLRYQLLKHLGELDKISEHMGVPIQDKVSKEDFVEKDQYGGDGYEIDMRSPYAIWEAIKQLERDLDEGFFEYYIINGKRFSGESVIQITAEASAFWITAKQKVGGTPLINRFINEKTISVKYIPFSS